MDIEEIKYFEHTLPKNIEMLELLPIGDTHIGARNHYGALLDKFIDYIKDNKNVYTVLTGDLVNNATTSSVSNTYEDVITPHEQCDLVIEKLHPIKDKILGYVVGNHTARSKKSVGFDIGRYIADGLGIREYYSTEPFVLFISFGKNRGRDNRYTTYAGLVQHGKLGGGRTKGSKANAMSKMQHIADCDFYIHAHTHQPMNFPDVVFVTDLRNKLVKRKERMYINNNAFLLHKGYGASHSYPPSSFKAESLLLDGFYKNIDAITKSI